MGRCVHEGLHAIESDLDVRGTSPPGYRCGKYRSTTSRELYASSAANSTLAGESFSRSAESDKLTCLTQYSSAGKNYCRLELPVSFKAERTAHVIGVVSDIEMGVGADEIRLFGRNGLRRDEQNLQAGPESSASLRPGLQILFVSSQAVRANFIHTYSLNVRNDPSYEWAVRSALKDTGSSKQQNSCPPRYTRVRHVSLSDTARKASRRPRGIRGDSYNSPR